jgi:hypothetical protein
MHALVKSKLKTITMIAAVHSAVWWGACGALIASGLPLFTFDSLLGFASPPRLSAVQTGLLVLTCMLTAPLAWVPGLNPATWFTTLLVVAANGIIWGGCLSLLIYALRQRLQRKPA